MSDIPSTTAPLLSATGLSASWGKTEVLHSVSASFNKGEFVCMLGPNGSGKSTFLTLLSGLVLPSLKVTGGGCTLSGKGVSEYRSTERAKLITFLPQNELYTWNYSVLESVRMGRYAHNAQAVSYSGEDDRAAREALSMAGISHLEKRYIFELSGGEMQSVLIARSLAQNTDAMLLDEPFTFLDAGKADSLIRLLKDICHTQNKCLIMSIHDINMAPVYADRILLFGGRKLIADGIPSEVFTACNLEKAYGVSFTQYEHPVYKVPQVCVEKA